MNLALSEVLNLARKWQNASTEMQATMMIETREWVIDFNGRVIVGDNGLTITSGDGCECRLVLDSVTNFSYANSMLKIDGNGWRCNLYEREDKNWVRLV